MEKQLAKLFGAMSDPTRLGIINLISKKSLKVNEISKKIGISISGVSHQLKLLYDLDLVRYKKKGREKYYKIADTHVFCILKDGIEHIKHKGKEV